MKFTLFALIMSFFTTHSASTLSSSKEPSSKFQVIDSIRMTVLHEQAGKTVKLAPGGEQFLIVESSGLIEHNAREFRIRVFSATQLDQLTTAAGKTSLTEESVIALRSTSNRDAITQVRWVDNGKLIAFLGAQGDAPYQVFVYDLASKKLTQVTHHINGVVAYYYREGTCIFAARTSAGVPNYSKLSGMTITDESLPTLIFPDDMFNRETFATFVIKPHWRKAKQIEQPQLVLSFIYHYAISPDGRYAVAVMPPRRFPESWRNYLPPEYERGGSGPNRRAFQYQLVDLKTLAAQPIVDAPVSWIVWNRSQQFVRWSDDGTHFLLASTMAPLNDKQSGNSDIRRRQPVVVVQEVRSGQLLEQHQIPFFDSLKPGETLLEGQWNAATKQFNLQTTTGHSVQARGQPEVLTHYAIGQRNGKWVQIGSGVKGSNDKLTRNGYRLWVKEDANTPPTIWATHADTQATAQVLELNPALRNIQRTQVKSVEWLDDTGKTWSGSLLLPSRADKKPAPLVIELKYSSPSRFRPDGPYTTAFASQALASAGIAVLELNAFDANSFYSPREAPTQLAGIESAVKHFTRLGVVDPARIGLIGFSRTAFYVKYALTHSDIEFAAATVADGIDGGYLQYHAYTLNYFGAHEDGSYAKLYGGLPFGRDIEKWLQAAPTFNAHRVRTPVRIEAIGRSSALQEWEFFSALKLLKIPVEMIYIPHGTHVLVKPQERLISQQGNVDWFRYWLNKEINKRSEPRQYSNWAQLRSRHQQRLRQPRPPLLDWQSTPGISR